MDQLVDGNGMEWRLIIILAVGLIIFVAVRFLSRILIVLSARYKKDFGYKRYFPLLEMGIWLSFIYWSLDRIFKESVYFSIFFLTITIIGLAWLGWFGLKDYIAGIILRAQDVYDTGHLLTIGKIAGKISKLGYLNIEIENVDGSVLKIPYSKVTSKMHFNKNVSSIVTTRQIYVKVPKIGLLNDDIEKLRICVLNSPWHASYIQPLIQKNSEENGFTNLEIIASTIGKHSIEKLQLEILKFIEKQKES